MRWFGLILLCILSGLLLGTFSVFSPSLFGLLVVSISFVVFFYHDKDNKNYLIFFFSLLFLIPFQSYSFHLNGRFFMYPPFLMIEFLFLKLLIQNRFRISALGFVDFLFFLFFTSAIISTFQAVENPNWSIRFLYAVLIGGYMFYLCLKMLDNRIENLDQVIYKTINFLIIIAAIFGIFEYMLKHNSLFPHVPYFDITNPNGQNVIYRSSATFDHPLTGALLYSIFFPYNVLKFLTAAPNQRWLYGFASFVLLIAVQTTGSRSGIIFILLSCGILFIMFMYSGIFSFRTNLTILFSFCGIAPILYLLLKDKFARTFSIFETGLYAADLNRANSILWAQQVFADYWVWGMGPYNSDFLKTDGASLSGINISSNWGLENSWISLFLENGLVGTIPFILLQLYCMYCLLWALRKPASLEQRVLLISIFTAIVIQNISFGTKNASHAYLTWILYFLFFFLSERIKNQLIKQNFPSKLEESI